MRIEQIPELREVERHAPGRSLAGDSVTYEGEESLIFKVVEGRRVGKGAAMDGSTICYFNIPESGEIFHESELGEMECTGVFDWKSFDGDYSVCAGLPIYKDSNGDLFLKLPYVPVFWKYQIPRNPMTVLKHSWCGSHGVGGQGWRAIPFTLSPDLDKFDCAVIASEGDSFPWYANCTHYEMVDESLRVGQEVNCYGM
jgi:hypothetical protein